MGMLNFDQKNNMLITQAYGVPVTNLSTADFSVGGKPFKIKNDNADRVQLEVKYANSTVFVPTWFQPSWNEDLLIAIKQNALVGNLLYTT